MRKQLQIKLQISNCKMQIKLQIPVHAFNLKFAVCNLQFAFSKSTF